VGITLALAITFGLLSRWKVFEAEVFTQVTAGREILQTGHVQTADTWSYTARGQPWLNVEWLSCGAVALAAKLAPGYAALSWLRAALVALWIGLLLRLCVQGEGRPGTQALGCLVVGPWAYLICCGRFRLGPDLFAACLVVGLLSVLNARLSSRWKAATGVALLVLWTNFSAGTAPVGSFVLASFLLIAERRNASRPERIGWSAGAVLALFCNPHGWGIFRGISGSLASDSAAFEEELSRRLFHDSQGSDRHIALLLWLLLAFAATPAWMFLRRQKVEALPAAWRDGDWGPLVGIALTGLTIFEPRYLPDMVAFLLPVVGSALNAWLDRAGAGGRSRMLAWVAPPGLCLWGWMLPDHLAFAGRPLGSGLLETEVPVRSVEFLKTIPVQANLLNSSAFGGYLIAELPARPVSTDGRTTLHAKFMEEERKARLDTASFADFLRKWNVNAILDTIPSALLYEHGELLDVSRLLLPESDWALVFFDNCSVVYLRRIPEHAAVIATHEYHALQRGLPANYGPAALGMRDETRKAIRQEAESCTRQQPWNVYCHATVASFLLRDGHAEEARAEIGIAEALAPSNIDVLVGVSVIDEELDRIGEARAYEIRLQHVTSQL
jgi:hypothetical protein